MTQTQITDLISDIQAAQQTANGIEPFPMRVKITGRLQTVIQLLRTVSPNESSSSDEPELDHGQPIAAMEKKACNTCSRAKRNDKSKRI